MAKRDRDQILRARDRLAPLIERAFALGEGELAAMEAAAAKGGDAAALERFLSATDLAGLDNPLVPVTDFGREYPHYHVLNVLRDPEYFHLTCRLLYDIDLEPFQHVIQKVLWRKPMPLLVASRGASKSWSLALYAHLRLLFQPGCRVVMIGAAFRQSKVIFEYMEQMWANAPILRDLVGSGKGRANRDNGPRRDVDRCDFVIGQSMASALPIGPDGSKIRGQRANYIIGDEISSVNDEVFNNVVFGFASVSNDPVKQSREHRKVRAMRAMGLWDETDEARAAASARHNQVVLAGTADYAFGHFAKTYRMWRAIVYSKGDPARLAAVYPEGVPAGFDWRDYACVRLPASLLPARFLDEKIIGAAKAKLSKSQFEREYDASFPEDSSGFFRRSLIESCVVGRPSAPVEAGGVPVVFGPAMRGDPGVRHVIAVDPASEKDKFAVVVLAMHAGHRRVVHAWTTDRKSHQARKGLQQSVEGDYYRFCAAKLRSLMGRFPCDRLVLDPMGGGVAVEEALANPAGPDEQPVYRAKDPPGTTDRKPTDYKAGLHLIDLAPFAKADWVAEANHALKADFEQRKLLFPLWDTASEELALEGDKRAGRVRVESGVEVQVEDTLLDVVHDLEELKDELASIVVTRLPSGRERWDVPEVKLEGGKKGRQRKDRYSALLMANRVARDLMAAEDPTGPDLVGGVKGRRDARPGELYDGTRAGWVDNAVAFAGVKRHR